MQQAYCCYSTITGIHQCSCTVNLTTCIIIMLPEYQYHCWFYVLNIKIYWNVRSIKRYDILLRSNVMYKQGLKITSHAYSVGQTRDMIMT